MSVRWPGTLETTSFNLQLFLLDVDSLSLSCLVGNSPATTYALTTMIFPALILWLSFCHALSLCGCLQRCGLKRWKLPYTLNTMGLLLKVGFGTIAAVSLKPVMCFLHPNGFHSILSYPSVFCGESGHSFMMVCGSFLLTIFVLGFIVACSYAMWNLPAWSRKGEDSKVQTFRFCTSHFRFDVYWFSLLLLLRGLSFALAIAIGTNLPPLQTALASIVLVIYTITQASVRPWKAPVMNFADTLLGALFLLLVGQSIGLVNNDVETEALEYFTVFLLLLLGNFRKGVEIRSLSVGFCSMSRWQYLTADEDNMRHDASLCQAGSLLLGISTCLMRHRVSAASYSRWTASEFKHLSWGRVQQSGQISASTS